MGFTKTLINAMGYVSKEDVVNIVAKSAGDAEGMQFNLAGLFGIKKSESFHIGSAFQQSVWIYAAVNAISRNLKALKINVRKKGKEGSDLPGEHELVQYFNNKQVMDIMTFSQIIEASITCKLTYGEYFTVKQGKWGGKNLGELWCLPPANFEPIINGGNLTGWKYSGTNADGKPTEETFTKEMVMFDRMYNPYDLLRGLNPVLVAKMPAELDFNAAQTVNLFYINGSVLPGVIEHERTLTDRQFTRLLEQWRQRHQGKEKSWIPAILEGGGKWKSLASEKQQLALLDTKRVTREEILAIYSVPPAEVGVHEYSNYANASQQSYNFWTKVLIPEAKALEKLINIYIVEPYDKTLEMYYEFRNIPELQDDLYKKALVAKVFFDMGYDRAQISERLQLGFEEREWAGGVRPPALPAQQVRPALPSPGQGAPKPIGNPGAGRPATRREVETDTATVNELLQEFKDKWGFVPQGYEYTRPRPKASERKPLLMQSLDLSEYHVLWTGESGDVDEIHGDREIERMKFKDSRDFDMVVKEDQPLCFLFHMDEYTDDEIASLAETWKCQYQAPKARIDNNPLVGIDENSGVNIEIVDKLQKNESHSAIWETAMKQFELTSQPVIKKFIAMQDEMESEVLENAKQFYNIRYGLYQVLHDVSFDEVFYQKDISNYFDKFYAEAIVEGFDHIKLFVTGKSGGFATFKGLTLDNCSHVTFDLHYIRAFENLEMRLPIVKNIVYPIKHAVTSAIKEAYERRVTSGRLGDFLRNSVFSEVNKTFRANRVARTETAIAVNCGRNAEIERRDLSRKWVCSRTTKRHSHALEEIDNYTIGRGAKYNNTGLRHPCDPQGKATDIINCNCIEIPVI